MQVLLRSYAELGTTEKRQILVVVVCLGDYSYWAVGKISYNYLTELFTQFIREDWAQKIYHIEFLWNLRSRSSVYISERVIIFLLCMVLQNNLKNVRRIKISKRKIILTGIIMLT